MTDSLYVLLKGLYEINLLVYRDKNKKPIEFGEFADKFRVAFKLD